MEAVGGRPKPGFELLRVTHHGSDKIKKAPQCAGLKTTKGGYWRRNIKNDVAMQYSHDGALRQGRCNKDLPYILFELGLAHLIRLRRLDGAPDSLRGQRHVDMTDPQRCQRVDHSVHHRRQRATAARLA